MIFAAVPRLIAVSSVTGQAKYKACSKSSSCGSSCACCMCAQELWWIVGRTTQHGWIALRADLTPNQCRTCAGKTRGRTLAEDVWHNAEGNVHSLPGGQKRRVSRVS